MTKSTESASSAAVQSMFGTFDKSNQIAVKGFEKLSQFFLESAQENINYAIETNRRISGVKSLAELNDLHIKLAQEFIDRVAERNKAAVDLRETFIRDMTRQQNA